jgi:glycerol-3-phosphate acyltransferase PlsY
MKGIDIRKSGSGNIGATNAFRILGKKAGIFVLLTDALKGVAACLGVPALVGVLIPSMAAKAPTLALVSGIGAILGHNYTCWLRFKGGKGIATSAGVLFSLVPAAAAAILTVWILVFVCTRYVSLASILAAASLPAAAWYWYWKSNPMTVWVCGGLAALAIYKHRSNMGRLLNGTEHRFSSNKNKKENEK